MPFLKLTNLNIINYGYEKKYYREKELDIIQS